MMRLPETQALIFRKQLVSFEQEKNMPYLTDTEEIAINQGRQEGRQEGLALARQQDVIEALEIRFDRIPDGLREEILRISDSERLHRLLRAAIQCADLEAFAKAL
jgi:flagellar biosynthesis/type III secretory pathway protein FliH